MTKFKIWLLIILNFIFTFGTPIIAGYILFNNQISEKQGGSFFYLIVTVAVSIFFKRINTAIKKMKASYPKAIFKLFINLVVLVTIYMLVNYIAFNFAELGKLIIITIGGRLLAAVCEFIALKIDSEYIESLGVL